MWNKLRRPSLKLRLWWALLLSLLLHVWVAGGLDGWLPEDDTPDRTLIQVELMPPPPRPAPQPVKQTEITPARPAPQPRPARPAPEPAPEINPPPVAAASSVPVAAAMPTAVTPVEAAPPTHVDAPAEPEPPADVAEPLPKTPGKVVIDYQIVRKGGVAGVEHHSYQATEDGRYVLTSLAEAKGLLALALSDLVQRSEGRVTTNGLRPDSFLYHYGTKAEKAQKASFDWEGHVLTMEVGGRSQTAELQDGTQDLMSFMYQFMFVPPLSDLRLAVTNGKKLKVYHYGFEGEETLETKMGPVRAMHIAKSGSDGEEKTEIWLAADYHYLPVKISKTEKDGTVTERVATRWQIEAP